MKNEKIKIFLSHDDLEKLKKKKIGQGKEGTIYKVGHGLLYKIYYKLKAYEREQINPIYLKDYEIDEEGVKRIKNDSNQKKITVINEHLESSYYVDNSGVKKTYSIDQINEAIKRQKDIKKSSLPLGPIYIDNRLGGVVLKEHKGYFNFHDISILHTKMRLKLLKIALENLKELCDNNVYPKDFACQADSVNAHSNIMVNLKGDVQFIDLEGHSTIYTKEPNKIYSSLAYCEFYFLFLNIIFDEKLPDQPIYEDFMHLKYSLKNKGLNEKYIDYAIGDQFNYDIVKDLLYNYDKKEIKNKIR